MSASGRAFLAALAGELWAIRPESLSGFVAALEQVNDARFREERAQRTNYQVVDGVAHIPIKGVILKSVPEWFSWFGISATGTAELQRSVAEALDDREVRALMLNVDSPGGTIAGVQEAADTIYSARSIKPVHSHFESLAASAGYWLGGQAERVTASKSTMVGSIGVYRIMDDFSEMYSKRGIKTHVIRTHELKGVGIEGAPITENQLRAEQELIDRSFGYFVDSIARGRGRKSDDIMPSATGQVWYAEDAHSRGLIDAVSSSTEAHAFAATGGARAPSSMPLARTDAVEPSETLANATPPRADATQPAPDGARKETMSSTTTAVDTAAELAAAKREAEEAKREAAIAKKEAEIEKAALAEVKKQRCVEAIDTAAKAGRIAPSMRTMVDEYATLVGYDTARVEKHLADLPVVTRAEPKGEGDKKATGGAGGGGGDDDGIDPDAPYAVKTGRWVSTKEEDELVAKKLGISVASMTRFAKVKAIDPTTHKLFMQDGSVQAFEQKGKE